MSDRTEEAFQKGLQRFRCWILTNWCWCEFSTQADAYLPEHPSLPEAEFLAWNGQAARRTPAAVSDVTEHESQ